ncbi:hypothetical protein DCO48_05635 [Pseudomonas sp. SDI]|uniref:DUF1566 domain-containing protein n=1 Tax=Pseudomonas sp. SDI TaxID=2170734 RepID=UPI000DE75F05|nr:DUF1566 domain-containing protein [Pseudomonas sp. SDI]PWB34625.1 hypothetical protein DCO48_05635 [Pseudomonas sp. SDI]
MNVQQKQQLTPPAIGEYWLGQGGIYAGRREYPEGLCYVIFASADVGRHAYGGYGVDSATTDHIDGRTNTATLVQEEDSRPAAEVSDTFSADGLDDFYLPAIGELSHGWQRIPGLFVNEWYLSSSQQSANSAFTLHMAEGQQYYRGKSGEYRVHPVRRLLVE